MSEKTMTWIQRILYYILAPILILEFFLSDLKILTFTPILFGVSIAVLLIFVGITFLYKKRHPDYEYKPNEMYTRVLFILIFVECMYSTGIFG